MRRDATPNRKLWVAKMKLLLDENVPAGLRRLLKPHDVFTVGVMNWTGRRNGDLLELAARNGIDVVISLESGAEFLQDIQSLPCSVIVLSAHSNSLQRVRQLVPAILQALEDLQAPALVKLAA
jgi:predicted nuclease of predicted toxin-antitoxin system